jgi:dihydroorotate dehydrogenase electron transfer subunit
VENVRVARDTYRVRLACPPIARSILPGQFLMLRLAGCNDPLLGRPLALYDVVHDSAGRAEWVDVVYLAVGKMTRLLAALQPGAKLDVWGPLGNGFPATETGHLVMVAGGIGQTPFLALARECLGHQAYGDPPRQAAAGKLETCPTARRVTLCYGCRTAVYLACTDDFRRAGVEVHLSTEDGSAGHHGVVTDLIQPIVEESEHPCRIVACGPEGMLASVSRIARRLGLPCQVSLETPMACGIGICFSCVAKIRDAAGQWDYRRTCVEGPVFDAAEVEF